MNDGTCACGCGVPVGLSRQFVSGHNLRTITGQEKATAPTPVMQRAERFIERNPESGCWVWTGCTDAVGYAKLRPQGGKGSYKAHRIIYEQLVAPIPRNLTLDHLCRNRRCVNPEHMEPVTQGENTRRALTVNFPRCRRGHEFTPENTRLRRHGKYASRICRQCERKRTGHPVRPRQPWPPVEVFPDAVVTPWVRGRVPHIYQECPGLKQNPDRLPELVTTSGIRPDVDRVCQWCRRLWHQRGGPTASGTAPQVFNPHVRSKLRASIVARDESICGICGYFTDPADLHIDHIIPLDRGGINDASNLQCAHGRCNMRKGARV